MKKVTLIILFFCFFSNSFGNNNDSLEYIIITRLGITNYSFPSLILSTDSIKDVKYDDNYEEMIKYKYYDNIIISYDLLQQLYSLLNLTIVPKERQKGFSKEYIFIVDYRMYNSDCDYVLMNCTSLMSTLFTLKSIYCIVLKDIVNNEYLLKKISELYALYIKSYNSEITFNKEIFCTQ
ncbi:MAG: hypothetical protein AB7V36_14470 [Bacteroidales bacterium]